jgi:hypothetical protein
MRGADPVLPPRARAGPCCHPPGVADHLCHKRGISFQGRGGGAAAAEASAAMLCVSCWGSPCRGRATAAITVDPIQICHHDVALRSAGSCAQVARAEVGQAGRHARLGHHHVAGSLEPS